MKNSLPNRLPNRLTASPLARLVAASLIIASLVAADDCLAEPPASDSADKESGFVSLFDGQSLENWKLAEENPQSWQVEDGMLVCEGPRSHLFYDGPLAPMKDFHFKCEVKTTPGSNAGIYFHTRYQPTGWPRFGFECQVNVSHKDPKKTGSLYGVENVADPGVKDDQWYTQEIIVTGRRIRLIVDGRTLVDYTEPEAKDAFSDQFERRLGEGTIALQAHDPDSKVYFRNLRVKPL